MTPPRAPRPSDDQQTSSRSASHDDALLSEVTRFPLLEAMFGRRSRRFGLGMEIPDGPLAYRSRHDAEPLSELERALLVAAGVGVSGWNTGIEHTTSGAPDTACNYPLRFVGRTFASAAAIHSSELIFTDDNGTYLTQFRDLAPTPQALRGEVPAIVEWLRGHTVQLAPGRTTVPAEPPHTAAHNVWNANRPGSTLFAPVVDLTQQMLDVLTIYLGMGFLPYDTRHERPCGDLRPFLRSGLLDEQRLLPLADFEQHVVASGAMEASQMCHNMALVLQAIGLGGWMYTGLNALTLMGAQAERGIPGFGFRFLRRADWILPNPVGLDGHFEALCPPYLASMEDVVDRFLELKFGAEGAFATDRGGPYRDNRAVKSRVDRYSEEFIELLKVVTTYVHDTYGRFPATAPSMYMRPYVQAHHVDVDFYDTFYGEHACLRTHREHLARWHAK
ncbi:MAG: hypothetical protein R3B48_22930 [Kofleriaceae bacterium]